MTAEQLSSVAGLILSLLFAYVPGVKDWYAAREPTQKAGLMALLLVVVAVGALAASCGQILSITITCDKSGAVGLVSVLVSALVANQATYVLLVRPMKPQQA